MSVGRPDGNNGPTQVQNPTPSTPASEVEGELGHHKVKKYSPKQWFSEVRDLIYKLLHIKKPVADRKVEALTPSKTAKGVIPEYLGKVETVQLKDMAVRKNKDNEEILLGKGGFGEVYEAVQNPDEELEDGAGPGKLQRQMVMKKVRLLRPDADYGLMKELTEKEIKMQSRIRSHSPVHDFLITPDSLEYQIAIENGGASIKSLLQMAKGHKQYTKEKHGPVQRMPEKQVMELGRQLVTQLREVHSHGICHKDIKPDNMLVDNKGDLSLIDFGLAEQNMPVSQIPDDAQFDGFDGTPGYMAPELYSSDKYTLKADVWSAGIAMVEMLTGMQPYFSGVNRQGEDYFSKRDFEAYRENIKNDFLLSPDAKKLLLKMTEFSPGARCSALECLAQPFFNRRPANRMEMIELQAAHQQAYKDLAAAEDKLETMEDEPETPTTPSAYMNPLEQAREAVLSLSNEVKTLQSFIRLKEGQVESRELRHSIQGLESDISTLRKSVYTREAEGVRQSLLKDRVRLTSPNRKQLAKVLKKKLTEKTKPIVLELLNKELYDLKLLVGDLESELKIFEAKINKEAGFE